MQLDPGGRRFDLSRRALVMGVLNRTRDSFHDRGASLHLDALLQPPRSSSGTADVLDVGARAGGVGVQDFRVQQELELAAETIEHLRERFDVPVSIDTRRAVVAAAAYRAGATRRQRHESASRHEFLPAPAAAGAR